MSGSKGWRSLEPRERRLATVLLVCLGIMLVVMVPLGVESLLAETRERVESLSLIATEIEGAEGAIVKADAQKKALKERYAKPAPPLPGLLDGLARGLSLEVDENQDQPVVPHGKNHDERATKMTLRRTGLASFAKFLEKVAQTGHPIVVSRLNIRKRLAEPDSFDIEVVLSAYDRKEKEASGALKSSPSSAPREETGDEEPEQSEDGAVEEEQP